MKENPRILLRSGWAVKNIGDIGHTPGTLRLLTDRFPDAHITVWASNINEPVEEMIRRRFPDVAFVRGHMYDKEQGCPTDLMDALNGTDLFLYNSGMLMNYGLFNHDWNGPVYNLVPLWHCIEKGIPFGIYGQSFDRFDYPSVHLFRTALDHASFIFTRDTPSAEYLKESGFTCPRIEFGPDGCFGIDVRDDAAAEAWLRANELEPGKFLAMIIRTNTAVSAASSSPLNPVKPNASQQAENERWMRACATVVTKWVRESGLKVAVLPEAEKEMDAASAMLWPLLPEDVQAQTVIRDRFWNADEALSVYAQARAVFGMEPHSLIMALTVGVPVVHARPLRHGRKGWMFDDIGLGDWLFDIDTASAEEIADTVVRLHVANDAARARAREAMDRVRARQAHTMDVIAATLEERTP